MINRFPSYRQYDSKDCGPVCIKNIAKYYGKELDLVKLRLICETNNRGTNLFTLSQGAEKVGFKTVGLKIDYETLSTENILPCIAHWNKKHYVIIYKISKSKVWVSDPALGLVVYTKAEFIEGWIGLEKSKKDGVVLFLDITPSFFSTEEESGDKRSIAIFSRYVLQYKKYLFQIFIGLLTGSLISLITPFLTQAVIDNGIQFRNLNLIYLVMVAQVVLLIGHTSIGFIRSWILMHMNTRISISIVSDFFIKLLSLEIAYFDSKKPGDIIQRISDHKRIETLLSGTSLNVLFSLFNFIIFGSIMAYYSGAILAVFLGGSVIHALWIFSSLNLRKKLDHKRFAITSSENNKVYELINGIQEIKLFNMERQKRWDWEHIQARIFRMNIQRLKLSQFQEVGTTFINNIKNIFITILSANMVIDGNITLGMMVSISYILGQLNSPMNQFLGLINTIQDAKISLNRINEIYGMNSEDNNQSLYYTLPNTSKITFRDVAFRYPGMQKSVFEGVNLTIDENKVTAIVGPSGSGKTTLLKLLLKIYAPTSGDILVGSVNLKTIQPKTWRDNFGIVMQEGYLFNSTIAENIAVGEENIDKEKLVFATKTANLIDFIEELPEGYNTEVGFEGRNVSTGQKQRLLIARAVYKNPPFLFFDEATSALDSKNERVIMENLTSFFENKTVIIIAHRLSTVRNADQIIVMNSHSIAEIGSHDELVAKKGFYYNLIKNQLELNNG